MCRGPLLLLVLLTLGPAPLPAAEAPAPPADASAGLGAADDAVRIQAARALGDRGDVSAFPALIDALSRSPSPEVQAALINALDKLDYTPDFLIETLKTSPQPIARAYAAFTLGRMRRPEAVPALSAALTDPDPQVRERAMGALGTIGDPRALQPLVKAAHRDPSPTLRARAEAEAARLADPHASLIDEDVLLASLKHPDPSQRAEAAFNLGKSGSWWAVEPLIQALDDAVPNVRERAAAALGELGDKRAAPALAVRLPERQGQEKALFIAALSIINDTGAAEVVLPALQDPDATVRRTTARALRQIGDPVAVPALQAAFAVEAIPSIRQEYLHALGRLADPRALPTLVSALAPTEAEAVRCEAARALSSIDDPRALAALMAQLHDPEPLFRAAVVDALAQRADAIGNAEVLGVLSGMTKTETDAYVREAALEAVITLQGRARREGGAAPPPPAQP